MIKKALIGGIKDHRGALIGGGALGLVTGFGEYYNAKFKKLPKKARNIAFLKGFIAGGLSGGLGGSLIDILRVPKNGKIKLNKKSKKFNKTIDYTPNINLLLKRNKWELISKNDMDKKAHFKKIAFGPDINLSSPAAGGIAGVVSGYSAGRQGAGSVSNILSRRGYKTKNEEIARNIGRFTGLAGGIGGLALAQSFTKGKRFHKDDTMNTILSAAVPFGAALLGAYLSGAGTGALTSLRGRLFKKKENKKV